MFWSLPKDFGATKLLGISLRCLLRCSGLWLTLLCGKDPDFSKIRDATGIMSLSLTYRLRVLLIVSVVRPIALNLSDESVTIFVCFRRQAYSRYH